MCLDVLYSKIRIPESGIAFKVMQKANGKFRCPSYCSDQEFSIGDTVTEPDRDGMIFLDSRIRGYPPKRYPKGYHFYKDVSQAILALFEYFYPEEYAVIKIKYSEAVADGMQDGSRVSVARTITLEEELDIPIEEAKKLKDKHKRAMAKALGSIVGRKNDGNATDRQVDAV
jgi:hypothetical protein